MWISREVWVGLRAELVSARQTLEAERDRYDRLAKDMAQMVRDGYRPASAAVTVDLPSLSERLSLAITELAGGTSTPTGRHLARYALQQLGAGVSEDAIIERIRNGE